MAVLVTRPHPDDEATAAALRARGLRCCWRRCCGSSRSPFHDDEERAMAPSSSPAPMRCAPSNRNSTASESAEAAAVRGRRTYRGNAARDAGFAKVTSAKGDAARLRDLVLAAREGEAAEESRARCSISRAPISRATLPANSARSGFTVVTHTTYRMVPVPSLPQRRLRRLRRQSDRGGAALFPPQRARVPGCGAGRGRRNIGAGAAAMLHFRKRGRRSSATPAPPR